MNQKTLQTLLFGIGILASAAIISSWKKCDRGCQNLLEHVTEHLLEDLAAGLVEAWQARVGFYYIRVRFGSGNETRVDFNGNNPAQPRVLDFRTIE